MRLGQAVEEGDARVRLPLRLQVQLGGALTGLVHLVVGHARQSGQGAAHRVGGGLDSGVEALAAAQAVR